MLNLANIFTTNDRTAVWPVGGASCSAEISLGKAAGLILDWKCSQTPGSKYLFRCQATISVTSFPTVIRFLLFHWYKTWKSRKCSAGEGNMYFYALNALKDLRTLHWRAHKPLETLIRMTETLHWKGKGAPTYYLAKFRRRVQNLPSESTTVLRVKISTTRKQWQNKITHLLKKFVSLLEIQQKDKRMQKLTLEICSWGWVVAVAILLKSAWDMPRSLASDGRRWYRIHLLSWFSK